ncbi:MAG TPA: leucine-rich repeat protein [Candidatus Limihabitans stercoravium]|nr:leucine-rich repeat protein [Candidatus Limihabitans stercoravium]
MKKIKFGITVLVILTIIVVLAACQPSNPTPQPAGKVTVVFDLNGGEMSEQPTVQIDKGGYLKLPVPTRIGYAFIGWFVGEGVNAGQVTNTTVITQNITITAHWKANKYIVSFVETGDNSIADVSVTYGQDCTLPTPTRTGYTFIDWFNGDNKVESGTWNIARNTTLVAHWKANTYTVTFETGIGQEIEPMEVTFGDQYTLPSPEPEHYTFMGWYNNYSEVGLTGNWSIASDVTLVASWQEVEYTVTYNNAEDCFNENPTTITISQLPYTLKDAGKNDHVFEGWYVDPDFTTRVTQIDQLDMTLYAKFTVATSGFQFKTTENGVAVTGYNGAGSDIIIPSYHNGFVTSIGGSAFIEHSVTSVVIPTSVTSIGESAFSGCRNLISVVIPSSVVSIGNSSFFGCTRLTSIEIPSSVTSIEDNAFYGCYRLTSVIVPSSVTNVGQDVFANCSGLTIYCGVEGQPIGWNADWNPSNRPVVWGIKGVGSTAEYDYVLVEGGIYLSKWKGADTIVTVPSEIDGLAVVGLGQAFAHSNVVAVKILSNVKSVAKSAFYDCSSLVSVEIPSSVTSIGSSAFSYCSSLASIEIPTDVTSIGENAFWNCSSLASIVIPVGVTCIADGTFSGCSDLTSIVIPTSVTSIGNSAFSGCSSLVGIVIPSGVRSIGDYAFNDCSGLFGIEIPSGVTSIEGGTFYGCSSLVSVFIPSSVTSIGYSAFGNCKNLTIYCQAESQPSGWNTNWNGSFFDIVHSVVWGYKG